MSLRNVLVVVIAGILWSCVVALQRPAPRYSQQFMPDTAFTCRNKIVGSYYADPETDCQVFHVCVSVAGSIQDYKFLCPNDTAFDQESQTCADWYDVDCEAATLYYASDNFDLYRLGSGLESLHYDSIRTDAEPQDNLQRSETSDPVRSAANNLNHVSQNNNYNTPSNSNGNNNNRDILRGSSSSNFYNSRNNGKDEDYDNEKTYKEEPVEPRKKSGVRKVARKHQLNTGIPNNNNNNININAHVSSTTTTTTTTTTPPPPPPPPPSAPINHNNGNYNINFNSNFNNYNSRRTTHEPTTITRPAPQQDYNSFDRVNSRRTTQEPTTTVHSVSQQDYNSFDRINSRRTTYVPTATTSPITQQDYNNKQYNQINQKYYGSVTSTYRPTTLQQNYQSSSTTIRPSPFSSNKNYNSNYQPNYGQAPTTVKPVSFSQSVQHSPTTSRPTTYKQNYQNFGNHAYNMQYSINNNNNNNYNNDRTQQSSTIAPSTNYQQNDYENFQQKNYNNIPRASTTIGVSPTTFAPTHVDNYNVNTNTNYNNQNNGRSSSAAITGRQASSQTTKFYPNYSASSYVPTTYSPVAAKKINNGNNNHNDNGQYYDKSSQQTKSTQYYDSTKAPKKATQNINYDSTNAGKYFETSTINYDFARSQAAVGFSPSSINLLAESPKSTTPVPRRTGGPTTYNPNNYNHRVTFQQQQQPSTTARSATSGSAKQFSTNAAFTDSTSPKPKSSKKNDYDYAYYDNAGGLEYDGLDLDHVARNKESSKISRN